MNLQKYSHAVQVSQNFPSTTIEMNIAETEVMFQNLMVFFLKNSANYFEKKHKIRSVFLKKNTTSFNF